MHLLWLANFAPDTGYAWHTIEAVFRAVGERLVRDGHRVSVCYARPGEPSAPMRGAPFRFLAFDYERESPAALARLIGRDGVDALYLTDRPTWALRYALFRLAGVRRILVHDRTSGDGGRRSPVLRWVKRRVHAAPWVAADRFIGVSEFVRRRLVEVNGAPVERTHRVYNGIDLSPFAAPDRGALRRVLGLPGEVPIVFCSGRAQPYKGVQVLVEAAARLRAEGMTDVAFAYVGDGAYRPALEALARTHGLADFHFLGRRADVPELLSGASLAVVPSLWAEAFGLTVVEAMAAGVPLVATRAGGIPELVQDGVTGRLVEPGDPAALAAAIAGALRDPAGAAGMAARAALHARAHFGLDSAAQGLYDVVSAALGPIAAVAARPGTLLAPAHSGPAPTRR